MSKAKTASGAHAPCIDLLACPFGGHSFDRSSIKKSYMGEVWDQYTGPLGCWTSKRERKGYVV